MFKDQQNINYNINKEANTATIVLSNDTKDDILIPSSIIYNSKKYKVTDISEGSFKNSKISSIKFAEDSSIESIPKDAFAFSSIQRLQLSSNIKELKEGWCHETPELTCVSVLENNRYYKTYENNLLIGKDNDEILYFANRLIETVTIPSTVKQISSYAFENCTHLKKINISKDSQLLMIKSDSFAKSSLEELEISSKVEELSENWCRFTPLLKKVIVSPMNQNFVNIGNKIIIGKSNRNDDKYNILQFVSRDVSKAIIPTTIQYINPSAISKLSEIKTIEINLNISTFLMKLQPSYNSQINQIKHKVIRKVYSKFDFKYYRFNDDKNSNENAAFNLFFYLVNFKFIVFFSAKLKDDPSSKNDCVFCIEGECIVIENIEISMIKKIIESLKKYQVSLIDVSYLPNMSIDLINYDANDEIESFCDYFLKEIDQNTFVRFTIRPIIGFIIRRYYFPSNYFLDKSFFIFDQGRYSDEFYIKKINDYLVTNIICETNSKESNKLKNIMKEVSEMNEDIHLNKKEYQQEFEIGEFIVLRKIYENEMVEYFLVIHIQSLYIFMMEKIDSSNIYSNVLNKRINREINMLEHSNRYFTKIYGLLKQGRKTIGMIYEFMSNGSLCDYLKKREFDEIYMLMIIMRIFEGINYLHINDLVHRDLKPGNILINHDGLPFISDFETIRSLEETGPFTNDIGSMYYLSPEQYKGEEISYSTDIYSFGQIIKYLLKKRSKFTQLESNNKNIQSIEELCENCVLADPDQRIDNTDISLILIEENSSFYYFEKYLLNETIAINNSIIVNYIYDMITNTKSYILHVIIHDLVQNFIKLFSIKIENDKSFFLLSVGLFYEKNEYGKNYLKSKEYYEKSSLLNNSDAFNKLGEMYQNGYGVEKDFIKAYQYYMQSSLLGNQYAHINLGFLYYNGYGVEKDYKMALLYFKKSSLLHNSDAFYYLGDFYFNGYGVKQDYHVAKKYYENSSFLNNSKAMLKLGDFYYYGYGVKQNYLTALKYYEKSALLKNSDAFIKMGDLYYYGYGVKQDYIKAKEYYEESSKFDNSYSFIKIGDLYYHGYGVKQSYKKAKEYYEKSKELYNSDAMLKLGDLYFYGYGVKQDYKFAKYFYEHSACYNNSIALNKLGEFYEKGNGVKRNYQIAMNYYMKSASLKNPDATLNIGNLYENGFGVGQNFVKAKKYYEESLLLNNINALYKLGDMYYYGNGVRQNTLKAKEYYEKSAKFNDSRSLIKLGDMYYDGYGIGKDFMKALYYYEKLSSLNNSVAFKKIGDLYYYGYGVKQNYLTAMKYYEKSSFLKNSDAMLGIGDLYYYGYGVKQDYLKAKEYYEKSSFLENSNAMLKLGELYLNGKGVKQDFLKAKEYYQYSSEYNNPKAFFELGNLYSDGDIFEINLQKAIEYFLKSIDVKSGKKRIYNQIDKSVTVFYEINNYRYISYNKIGLIYYIFYNDMEKADEYFKESAFGEYPFGQNNFGLFNQFYLNNISKAEYMYQRSLKHNFSLAEYNLGYLREKDNKIQEAIQYYIQASEHENEQLIFRNINHYDKRLEISKKFIICLTNLKLVDYFYKLNNYDESKKYFNKSICSLKNMDENNLYEFKFHFKVNNETDNECSSKYFSYIKEYILNFPLFNLSNQSNPNLNKKADAFKKDDFQLKMNEKNFKLNEFENTNEKIFDDPKELFDYFICNSGKFNMELKTSLKTNFINQISEIITIMNKILYTKPYHILFGYISLQKPKMKLEENVQSKKKDIDHLFYEGLGEFICFTLDKDKLTSFYEEMQNNLYNIFNNPFGTNSIVKYGDNEEEEQEFNEEEQEFNEEEQEFNEEE